MTKTFSTVLELIPSLDKDNLNFLLSLVNRELERRKELKLEEILDIVLIQDGCEGSNFPFERFNEVDAEKLKEYIYSTIDHGSEIIITRGEVPKDEYEEHMQQYSWFDDEQDKAIKRLRSED